MTGPLDPAERAFLEKEKLVKDAQREELDVEVMLSKLPHKFAKFTNEDKDLEEDTATYLAKKYDKRVFNLIKKPWKKALR